MNLLLIFQTITVKTNSGDYPAAAQTSATFILVPYISPSKQYLQVNVVRNTRKRITKTALRGNQIHPPVTCYATYQQNQSNQDDAL